MDTNLNYKVFEGDGFPVEEPLLDGLNYEQRQLSTEMQKSGHYNNGLWVDKFLREDLSINLEKLELAVTLIVTSLESNAGDTDITLELRGLDRYYERRGIVGDAKAEREERMFLIGFISTIAGEASTRDTLQVKFVQ